MTAWREWQDSPWGRIRYSLAEANLVRHLDGDRLRVLDIGGGDGGDAVPLAARGHHVTIVDRAPKMLAAAGERAEAAGVAVTVVEADVMDLPSGIRDGDFDVVLCHNLVQYVDDVAETLRAVAEPMRPGGLLSVMAINRHAQAVNLAVRRMDLAAARAALDSNQAYTQTFDTAITLYTAEEITVNLAGLGLGVAAHYGIRSICDYMTDDDRKREPEFFAELLRLEHAVTDRYPYPHLARLFQLVAQAAG